MSLPTYKIKKIKATDNNTYEIIPERLQNSGYEATLPTLSANSTIITNANLKTVNNQSLVGSGNIVIEGGGSDYDELDHIPIINLTSDVSGFENGDTLVNGDKIYFNTDNVSGMSACLSNLTYTMEGGLIELLMAGNDRFEMYAYNLTSMSQGYILLLNDYYNGSRRNTVIFGTQAGGLEGLTWNQGYNNLAADGSFTLGLRATETLSLGSSSSSWNGSLIAPTADFATYDDGVYYRIPDESITLTNYSTGDTIAQNTVTYFDTSRNAELDQALAAAMVGASDTIVPVLSLADGNHYIAVVDLTEVSSNFYVLAMVDNDMIPVYSTKSNSSMGISKGWTNIQNNGYTWTFSSSSTINAIQDQDVAAFIGKAITKGTKPGSIYRNEDGILKKVLLEGDVTFDESVEDVKINGTSILQNKIANIITNSEYNASSNKIATMSDLPDLSTKMDKTNPTGTGSLSIGRKSNTTVGDNSVAVGQNTVATNYYSFAEGLESEAHGEASHAEGGLTYAIGGYSHAEGYSGGLSYIYLSGNANSTTYTITSDPDKFLVSSIVAVIPLILHLSSTIVLKFSTAFNVVSDDI